MSFTPLLPNNSHFSKTFPGLRSRARPPAGLGRRRTHASSFMHSGEKRTTGRRQRGRRRRRALPLPPSLSYIGAPASSVAVHAVSSVQRFCGNFSMPRGVFAFSVSKRFAKCLCLRNRRSFRPSQCSAVFQRKGRRGNEEGDPRQTRKSETGARTAPAFSSGGSRRPRARMPSSLPLCSLGSLSHFVALSSFGGKRSGGR